MALTDNLVAYWDLDEASGNALDAHGTLDLTDNNTVGTASGIGGAGSARAFVIANTEYFSRTSEAALQMGDIDFTLCGWMYISSHLFTNDVMIGKYDVDGATRDYLLFYNANDHTPNYRFSFVLSSDGTAATVLDATTFGEPADDTWYFVCARYDAAGNSMGISINDGTEDTASHTGGAFASASEFRVGALDAGGPYYLMGGRLQYIGIWKRRISDAERTTLYNGGSGLAYSGLGGGAASTRGAPFGARGTAFNGGRTMMGLIR